MGCVTSREKSLRESGLFVFVEEHFKKDEQIFKNTNYCMLWIRYLPFVLTCTKHILYEGL